MARKGQREASGHTILVVDDNEEYLASTVRLLAREGHDVFSASSGKAGLEIARRERLDVVLVDYFMPAMTGEQFVLELRTFAPYVQVVLQTGYSSERPAREMLRRLDIQGYHDKSEGPDKLCLWVDVAIRAAFTLQLLQKSRAGLEYILAVTPELHRIQPLDQLLQGILLQTVGLLGAVDSFLAVASRASIDALASDGFVATVQSGGGGLRFRAATGRFADRIQIERPLSDEELAPLARALETSRVQVIDSGTVVPLRVGDAVIGLIFVDRCVGDRDREILAVFANQAAVAIHNVSLYELAAVDQTTSVYTRRFFEQALLRELRSAYRCGGPTALLMVDVDDMKSVNDRGGHLAGDQALAGVGTLLKRCTRATDIVGRYGGDEFAVVLPGTDREGAEVVVRRILAAASDLRVGATPITLTVGMAALDDGKAKEGRNGARSQRYFEAMTKCIVSAADEALYEGKGAGRARAGTTRRVAWRHESSAPPS
jgi:diguanylate cyclase (GGDEF)-like protein